MEYLTTCQKEAMDIARKKSKIHQYGLIYQIKNILLELNLEESFLDEFNNFINNTVEIVSHSTLTFKNILDEPVFKSVYETKTKGDVYLLQRTNIESKMFNKKYDNCDIKDRPKYASLNISLNKNGNPLCSTYGNKVIVFNDNIKKRSSFMYGDSFGGQMYLCTFEYPYALLYHLNKDIKKIQNIMNRIDDNLTNYIEVQIHGHIDLVTDIKKIIVKQKEYENELTDILIFKELYEHIEIVIIP